MRMQNKYLYVFIVFGIIIVLVGGLSLYKRSAVVSCTQKAAAALTEEEFAPIAQGKNLYDLIYRICMGKKGFGI